MKEVNVRDDDDDDIVFVVAEGVVVVVIETKGEYSRINSSSSFLTERNRGCPRTMGGLDDKGEGMVKEDRDKEHMSTSGIEKSWI